MKIFLALLVAVLAFNGIFALPAGSPNDDVEVIDVPRKRVPDSETDFRNFRGVIDTGSGYPFLQPHPNPFSLNLGFFDSFENIFRRLSTRLWPLALAGDDSDESDISFKLDPKKGNTTSTVEVIDGHKIEVNETVYGDGVNNIFKVRVVNIRPVDSNEDDTVSINTNTNTVTSAPKSPNDNAAENDDDSNERREPLERESNENEIRGNIDDPEVKKLNL